MPAIQNIPGLPVATALNGTEEIWAVQNGLDVRVTATQIAALGGGGGGGGFGNLTPVNGVLIANGTHQPLVVDPGVSGQVLTSNGAGIPPTYQVAPSGTVSGGGTGLNSVPAGDLLAGNGVNPLLLIDPGTTGQVLTSNGPGVPPSMQAPSSSSGTVPNGGTGRSTLAVHGVLIGQGASAINVTTPGTAGQVLTSNGASADPTFQAVPTPTIDVPHGGTGVATLFAHGLLIGNGTGNVVVSSPGTAGQVLTSNGASADPTMQNLAVTVPQGGTGASTLTIHGVVIGQGTSAVHITAAGTAGQALLSNGAAADPTFQTIPIPNVDVPHGGTGVATLTNHGVLIGQGTSALHITSAGTAGFVLTSNGASADPTFQASSSTYPPTPTPDFQTYCQAQFEAGLNVNWIWGPIVLDAPVRVNFDQNNNGFVVNLNGATVSPSAIYPVDTTVDMVTFIIPNSAPSNTNIQGFHLKNGVFLGINPSAVAVCRNCVVIACQLNVSGIYNGGVSECEFVAAGRSGLQLYGSVFEWDVISCGWRDNHFAGCEMRNPNVPGAGIISSINFFGGDARTNGTGGGGNGYGIASTAESAFQEAGGFYIYSTNFISNASAGVLAPAGVALIIGSHFENNCGNNGAETDAGVWVTGGGTGLFYECQAAHSSFNPQLYFVRYVGSFSAFLIQHCFSFNENTGGQELTGVMTGSGTVFADSTSNNANYNGGGGWTAKIEVVTSTAV